MNAAVYCRISDDREGAGLGVARQEADCRAICDKEGWMVADVLVDNDRSAYTGKRRPAYETLLEGLQTGRWQVVVAWHPDRLTRSPRELETLIDVLEASKVTVRTVTAGEYDLATASGRMTARVVGAVARHESEHKAERQRRKHREIAENGGDAGGGRCFGYRDDRLTVDPVEAELVRQAARAILDGRTLRSVVVEWTDKGVPTVLGAPWRSQVVRRLLMSPRIAGFREYDGRLFKAQWEPLVDEVTWRRLRAVLSDPARSASRGPRSYLLTGGLAVCGIEGCGAGLVARPKADGRRCYVCASPPMFKGCGKIRILADEFEKDVAERLIAAYREGRVPSPPSPPDTTIEDQIRAATASLDELAIDYYENRLIPRDEFVTIQSRLRDRLDGLYVAQAGQERVSSPVVDTSVVDAWHDPKTPLDLKRRFIEWMTYGVVVNPAVKGRNFYDDKRVRILWRH